MILPKKHIKLAESLFAVGGLILSCLKVQNSVDELWDKICSQKSLNIHCTFDNFLLSLDYLYSIGVIDINEEGGIVKCI